MTSTLLIAPLAGSLVNFVNASFIVAGLLFIFALAGLSKFETSKKGNAYGILGMVIAIVATIVALVKLPGYSPVSIVLLFIPMLIGGAFGVWKAVKVEMTGMPELSAQLHSFVGLAAVLIGFNAFAEEGTGASTFQLSEIWIGIFIGALTFTGSLVAWGKLSGKVASKPLTLPGRNWINLGLLVVIIACGIWFSNVSGGIAWLPLALLTLASLFLGFHFVAAIGGAVMPVVISMLNSYSGWAAAFSGFSLHLPVLIVTGALVGFSGAILSYIMCKAMNRSFVSVILGGFGDAPAVEGEGPAGEITEIKADELASQLSEASSVIIAPGYGMAVAQALYPVAELAKKVRDNGVDGKFAIHPVAGRLPGHMNVLLAEAHGPYDIVMEMDEINDDFADADVVLVIGANDTVNPAAMDPGTPISGMPVLHVWEGHEVVGFKRSMKPGYAGVENPLFFADNTRMLFGDAKASVDALVAAL